MSHSLDHPHLVLGAIDFGWKGANAVNLGLLYRSALIAVFAAGGACSTGAATDSGDNGDDSGDYVPRDTGPRRHPDASMDDSGDNRGNDASTSDGTTGTPTWCDLQPLISGASGHCKLCHDHPPNGGAPFSLTQYADTQLKRETTDGLWSIDPSGTPVYGLMSAAVNAAQNPMPPPSEPQLALSSAQKDLIRRWALGGGPSGGCGGSNDGGTDGGSGDLGDTGPTGMDATAMDIYEALPWLDGGRSPADAGTDLAWFDVFAHQQSPSDTTKPFAPPVAQTTYYCFAFVVPPTAPTQYIVSFDPIIDNEAHIHHAFVFRVPGNMGASDGSCLGLVNGGDLIGSWFPGRGRQDLPPNVGVRTYPGDYLVLQVHYDSVLTGPPAFPQQYDMSGFRILMSSTPTIVPAGLLWGGYQWTTPLVGTNAQKASSCSLSAAAPCTPTGGANVCATIPAAGITVFADIPHMHQYGVSFLVEVDHTGTGMGYQTFQSVPAWSFGDQPIYPVDPSMQQFRPGDLIRTTCTWNLGTNQVSWGEGSQNEMCFNFLYHYPLIPGNLRACVQNGP
jgi:hypothetical protein